MNYQDITKKIREYKYWILLIFVFILVRIIVAVAYYFANLDIGGWNNIYAYTDLSYNVVTMKHLFKATCGGLPFYFVFTSFVQAIYDSHWSVYVAQIFATFFTFYFSYKSIRLYFSKNVAVATLLLLVIDPFYAWYNFMFASGNLFCLFFASGLYNFLLFIRNKQTKNLVYFSLLISISVLVRATGILLIQVFSVIFIILFFYYKFFEKEKNFFGVKTLLLSILFMNFCYALFVGGAVIKNKIDYNDYRLAPDLMTNVYFFNVPELLSLQEGISNGEARKRLTDIASREIDFNITNIGDCNSMGQEKFNLFLDYVNKEGKKYIWENWFAYSKIHFYKMIPYYLQSGYFQMYEGYFGSKKKPNISSAIMNGEIKVVFDFVKKFNAPVAIYFFGIAYWGLASFSMFFTLIYSWFKDREKFVYILIINILTLYLAFTVSPFIMPRYKIIAYPFFLLSLMYFISIVLNYIKSHKIREKL